MTRAAKAFGAPGKRTPRWFSSMSRSVLMWLVGMALTPSRAAQDGMARIDAVDLDDRHSRRGPPGVSKPKLAKLSLALPMRQSQYYFGGEEVNRPFRQHAPTLAPNEAK